MSDHYEEIQYRGFNIIVDIDDFPLNPRTENDNMGTMACYHSSYQLGDREFEDCRNSEDVMFMVYEKVFGTDKANALFSATNNFIEIAIKILRKTCPVFLPLYILDHSGIWIKTGRFQEDPGGWDTSLVGFIFVTKETVIEEYGDLSDESVKKAEAYLEGEVKEYSSYLSGEVFCYRIEATDKNHSIHCDDACCGYVGYPYPHLIEDAKSNINAAIQQYREECKAVHLREKELNHFMSFAWAL